MVKLGSVSQHSDGGKPRSSEVNMYTINLNVFKGQTDVIVSLCSFGLMLCMVVAVLGIKFRWFKHRLNFEPIPTGVSGSDDNVVLTRSSRNSQEQFREPVVGRGIFRKKLDEDVVIEIPKTLPPVRVRPSSMASSSYGPPIRSETPSSSVEQPVAVPPPAPPLPSASTLSLSSLDEIPPLFVRSEVRTALPEDIEEKKVNFDLSTLVISNGGSLDEQLMTEDNQNKEQTIERRQTGYVRPDDEIVEYLQDSERELPKVQPRQSILSDKAEGKFKKKSAPKATKRVTDPINKEEIDDYKLNQRRLTGFFPPSDEDRMNIEDFNAEHNSQNNTIDDLVFFLDDETDEDNDGTGHKQPTSSAPPTPPTPPTPPAPLPPPPPPPPILFSSQISTGEERNSSDSWSAIERHRNLAREITEQHEAMQNRRKENAKAATFRNPLAAQRAEPKPRTMRDMKRNNAKSDTLQNGDRYDTEA